MFIKMKSKLKKINRIYNDYKNMNKLFIPHISKIEIYDNKIYIFCEKYSLLNNSMLYCFGEIIKDKDQLKKFKNLKINNINEVLSFIEGLNTFINWIEVNRNLNLKEKEKLMNLDLYYVNFENKRIDFSSKDLALLFYKDLIELYVKDESKKYLDLYKILLNTDYGYSDGSEEMEQISFNMDDYKNLIYV